ncbi:nuclear export mediator factor NEMF [Selaginella moellendorffii]|uniref:nuclear export mediator factor NEMF n=1 Tax=Selaginella moellendorffii TaxID=88036 RepID=UPI000D1C8251|nr:nuclear export mediator factor NEMF [Selaginella moellendorffii]|eukprot:XP_024524547.1 nuclear export mediator factor NEMF [Selaginella moellendorffii]
MVKGRLNVADVAAEVKCLRCLIGMRCANVYDLTPKTYVIKLAKSSGLTSSGEGERALVLLESGVRLHMTEFSRDKSVTPSGFTLKLRKHIRTRRLENVQQLGVDRVVDFQFGTGELAHHIILELYAQGNVLLTDADYNVLTLLRSHRDDYKGIAMMARHRYPVENCRTFQRTTMQDLIRAFSPDEKKAEQQEAQQTPQDARLQKKKDDEGFTLKSILLDSFSYGPAVFEHVILDAGLQPNMKVCDASNRSMVSEKDLHSLLEAIKRFEDWLESVTTGDFTPEGYITFHPNKTAKKKNAESAEEKMFDEFSPLLLKQSAHREYIKFDTFDAALDEFFSKIEGQRLDQQRKTQEDSAFSKLEKIRADQRSRVESLKREVDQAVHTAELIEYNLADVDLAIDAVRAALANGMDWKDLGRMIKEERKAGNPVAGLIHSLQLEKNHITLLLSNNLDDMDDDDKTKPADKVEVDLSLSAHANARKWFDMKKKQALKQEKTVAAHEKAFKAAERKTQQQLSQAKAVATISHLRKVHWFEKFNWFISSENYLIISGRDAQQNEQIVKRYMKKGDLYVHADLHGASSTLIKNHNPSQPVSPLTINQAGCFTVCRSQAWDSKIITSAWWVYDHQVSKTAPTGEYLTVGSFMIRGKKNFLPPYPLVMGFGLFFRLDESSIPAHFNERRIRAEGDNEEPEAEIQDDEEIDDASVEDSQDKVHERKESGDGGSTIEKASVTEAEEARSEEAESEEARAPETENAAMDEQEEQAPQSDSDIDSLLDKALELKSVLPSQVDTNKYGLGEVQTEDQVDDADQETKVAREKPYISKAERRKLKKGGNTQEVAQENEKDGIEEGSSGAKPSEGSNKQVRGKKGKLKKLKKYAEQDDEERELRMSLLSSAGREKPSAKEQPEKPSVKNEDAAKKPVICYTCKKSGHVASECPDSKQTESEIAAINAEENIVDLDEEEREKLTELDALTGRPLPNDILLYAVPVCGPYSALQSYKYHVKITPGPSKKGKGAKMAMDAFIRSSDVLPREKELMKAVAESDLVACMIGNVKVSAPGLAKLKQSQKSSKKKAAVKKDKA